jgi:hypothetical protein
MTTPTREEINVYNSLDEQYACENFLGKSLDEAESLFRDNALGYLEDLMWMGPAAFRYYALAAIAYIRSDHSRGDNDGIHSFASVLEFRLEIEKDELVSVGQILADACDYIIEHWDRFDADPSIYGDLRSKYRAIGGTLRKLGGA